MQRLRFPDPETADPVGLVAVTRELTTELLLEAYSLGFFLGSESPCRCFSPAPRAIFLKPYLRLPKRLGKLMRCHGLHVPFDTCFRQVVQACSDIHRHVRDWITHGVVRAYG